VDPGAIIHVEGGFRRIVEIDVAISSLGSGSARVIVRPELDDPRNILNRIIENPDLDEDCVRLACPFIRFTFNLADDIFTPDDIVAHDIIINTDGADAIFIDRIVFHDIILPDEDTPPIAVAEPSSAMLIGSAGLFAAVLRRRRPAWLSPQRATSVPAATSQMRTTSS
jgi:hypothetical protein